MALMTISEILIRHLIIGLDIGCINGNNLYGNSKVELLPNQTIKGSFTLLEFDPNATAFSVSVDVQRDKPIGLTLAGSRMDFVNIPVPEYICKDDGIPMM